MKLITEVYDQVNYISEARQDGKKDYFIEGVFLQSEVVNRNGRRYPRETMTKEVARYNENYVMKSRAYGELGHPAGPTINLDRVSHMIKELKQDGNNVVGRAKIMDTPMGTIVKNLMDEGASLGVSSRGLGTLREKAGVNEVQGDFMLATAADIVADPSAPDAFVQGIMENVEWIQESGVWIAKDIEMAQKAMHSASKEDIAKVQLGIFEDFISKL